MLFELELEKKVLNDQQIQYTVKPKSTLLKEYMSSHQIVDINSDNTELEIAFINEQTPLLFIILNEMDNIPESIKNQFTL